MVGSLINGITPIDMYGLDDRGTSSTLDDKAHEFILRGVVTVGGDTFYSLMDPNKDSYVSVYVLPSAISNGSNFVYNTTYSRSYKWVRARY